MAEERREAGLVRVEFYVPRHHVGKIRSSVAEVLQILAEAEGEAS